MEGLGARIGRSSTRYGPVTVFSGPVRKWKKRWIHVSSSNINLNNNTNHSHQNHSSSNSSTPNGSNGWHLLLYRWRPLYQRDNGNNSNGSSNGGEKDSGKDDTTTEEPPRRKFKYIPIAVIEDQKRGAENEPEENAENQVKTTDTHPSAAEPAPRTVPMEENQENGQIARHDLNESLDLSLGLKACDGDSILN